MPSKRKTLDEYFTANSTRKVAKSAASCSPQHQSEPSVTAATRAVKSAELVPGLTVWHDFITKAEEETLLSFLDQQPWRTDLARRTMHYGGTYCLMPPRDAPPQARKLIEETILTAPAVPEELAFFVDRMVDKGLYDDAHRPAYCIVNEYLAGQGISAHVENFRFGEPVCSLTLAGEDNMRFHELAFADAGSVRSGKAAKAPKTGMKHDVFLERRSLAILKDEARNKWQHEIVRGRRSAHPIGWRRVSLTFRVDKPDRQASAKSEASSSDFNATSPFHSAGLPGTSNNSRASQPY